MSRFSLVQIWSWHYFSSYLLFSRPRQNKALTDGGIGYSDGAFLFWMGEGVVGGGANPSSGGLPGVWGNMRTRSFISKKRRIFRDCFEGTRDSSTIKRIFDKKVRKQWNFLAIVGNKAEKVKYSRHQGNLLRYIPLPTPPGRPSLLKRDTKQFWVPKRVLISCRRVSICNLLRAPFYVFVDGVCFVTYSNTLCRISQPLSSEILKIDFRRSLESDPFFVSGKERSPAS